MNLLDTYRYLAALEQHRHFGRAAAACHITQPALSNALRALEQHLGVVVVRRSRQYEGLTPEGERVLASARRVLHEHEGLLQDLASGAGQARGRLVLGTVPTAEPLAARFAARLLRQQPGLTVHLRALASHEIEQGLDRLALDLALGYTERLPQLQGLRLQAWPQVQERYHLLLPAEPAAPFFGPPLPWAEAAAQPLAMLGPEMHHRAIVDGVWQRLGLAVRPRLETPSVLTLLAAVRAGGLSAVLPGALVDLLLGQPGLQLRPLVEPELTTPIGFITHASAPPSRALQSALALAASADWLAEAAAHSGGLQPA